MGIVTLDSCSLRHGTIIGNTGVSCEKFFVILLEYLTYFAMTGVQNVESAMVIEMFYLQ